MLNLSDFNFHGHQGKQLKAYEVHKRSQPQGEKTLEDNTGSIIEEKNQELGRKTFLRHLSLK